MNLRYSVAVARPEDLHVLPSIESAAAKLLHGHAPAHVLDEVTDDATFRDAQAQGHLWVALERDTPVGFALVEMLAEDSPHLEEIDVHPDHGRRGLGTALVRSVLEWASLAGYGEVTLTTFRAVPWNMPFYSRLGFEVIPAEQLGPELVAVVENETARGLDPRDRVVMRYRTGATRRR